MMVAFSMRISAITLPQPIQNYLDSERLTEDETLPRLETDGKIFIEYVVINRVQLLTEFVEQAPTLEKQKLLAAAMEFSTPINYLAVLDGICVLKEDGKIDDELLSFAIRGTVIVKGFLSFNYQHSDIQALINRVKMLLPDDSDLQPYLDSILNGSQKIIDNRYLELYELGDPVILLAE